MLKKNYTKSIAKNIKSNYIRMMIVAVISFISSIVFARGLGSEQYGMYTYITWFTGTIACLCGFGIEGTVTKFLPQYYFNNDIEESRLLMKKILKQQVILITIISFILLVTMPLWKCMLKINTSNIYIFLTLAILNILPTILSSIFTSSVQALQKFDIFAKIMIQTQIITFIFNLIIVFFVKRIEYILIVLILSTIYQVIMYYKDIQKLIKFSIKDLFKNEKEIKEKNRIIKYAKYMYINIIWQQVVWTRSEYFFLGIYCSAKEIAMYGLSYSLVNMVSMIFSPIMNVINNYFSELVAKKEENLLKNIINKITKYFAILLLLILTYAYAFSGWLIKLLYSDKYDGVGVIFLIMLTGFVIMQILGVGASIPSYYEKQKIINNIGILSAIINIVLAMILIPKFGAKGAAIANTSSQVFCSFIVFIYIIKILKIKFYLLKILPSILVSCIAISFFVFNNNNMYRFIIIFIYSILYIYILIILKIINLNETKLIFKLKG